MNFMGTVAILAGWWMIVPRSGRRGSRPLRWMLEILGAFVLVAGMATVIQAGN